MEIPKFKIRCSAIGQIMTNGHGIITEKQLIELNTLSNKLSITKLQSEKLAKLIYKRDNPELSDTTKNYCKDWLREKRFDRKKQFASKYTTKGIEVEEESIEFLVDNDFLFHAEKNTERKSNDFLEGECDLLQPTEIIDAKNSYTLFSFPIFESENHNKVYEWQLQGYMELFDRKYARLFFILTNTPEHLIQRELDFAFKDSEFLTKEKAEMIEENIRKNHNFDDIEPKHRVKIFSFEKDNSMIEAIEKRVSECQVYINELVAEYLK